MLKRIAMFCNNLASMLSLGPWMFSGKYIIVLLYYLQHSHGNQNLVSLKLKMFR